MRPIPGEFEFADLRAMHFVGAVGEPQAARTGIGGSQHEVAADARGAVNLNGPIEHATGHGRRRDLDHGNLLFGGPIAERVHHINRIQHQPARLVDRNPRFGDAFERHSLFRRRNLEKSPKPSDPSVPRASHPSPRAHNARMQSTVLLFGGKLRAGGVT